MTLYTDENCPKCQADLQGDEIPEESRHLYGGTHFRRVIGISSRELDRVIAWRCPDCDYEEERK